MNGYLIMTDKKLMIYLMNEQIQRRLFNALELHEVKEEEFYCMIEKADNEYHQLHGKLEMLLQAYFINIHTELIEVVEE